MKLAKPIPKKRDGSEKVGGEGERRRWKRKPLSQCNRKKGGRGGEKEHDLEGPLSYEEKEEERDPELPFLSPPPFAYSVFVSPSSFSRRKREKEKGILPHLQSPQKGRVGKNRNGKGYPSLAWKGGKRGE